ncbi:hypothetical protein GGX14DRAFT_587983 [Mycena pura]|uniref:D-aminoacyl-tRNA deacylase n=1 Tax=Mycena pura TaxID=153505 RepID=A0AAD6Y6S7_9AGAR|nr:hypothetical protein GGX14DRAFT_587983 [Mycena pura]
MWKASVKDVAGDVLCVSQFTLMAQTKKGSKPDFHNAMAAEASRGVYAGFVETMRRAYTPEKVQDGAFGAMMDLRLRAALAGADPRPSRVGPGDVHARYAQVRMFYQPAKAAGTINKQGKFPACLTRDQKKGVDSTHAWPAVLPLGTTGQKMRRASPARLARGNIVGREIAPELELAPDYLHALGRDSWTQRGSNGGEACRQKEGHTALTRRGRRFGFLFIFLEAAWDAVAGVAVSDGCVRLVGRGGTWHEEAWKALKMVHGMKEEITCFETRDRAASLKTF